MTEEYIREHFTEIAAHESEIESRFVDTGLTADGLVKDNEAVISAFQHAGEQPVLIDSDFDQTLTGLLA